MKLRLFSIFFTFFIALLLLPDSALAQRHIRSIIIDHRNVFDEKDEKNFFFAPLMNSLHTMTKEYIILDELLFHELDDLELDALQESERNLRTIGTFSKVHITIDTVDNYSIDVTVMVQDRWSTVGAIFAKTGGGITNFGAKLQEKNLVGIGTNMTLIGLHRSENGIGWQGDCSVFQPRIFRSEFSIGAHIVSNNFRTDQQFSFTKPFRTFETPIAFSITGSNSFGDDFFYANTGIVQLLPFHLKKGEAWLSNSIIKNSNERAFITAYLGVNDVQRFDSTRYALDNTGTFLLGFSSLKQDFIKVSRINSYEVEDMPIGAWGTAVLGRMFPTGIRGDQLYYVGGQIEQSAIFQNSTYIFGRLLAGNGFTEGNPRYTYQEFLGIGHYRFSEKSLIALRFRQQTAWNWGSEFRQLILDNDAGLRGYPANQLVGQNRIVSNLEYRAFPDFELWVFKFSGVAFYDAGAVWNQGTSFDKIQFHHAVGLGFRIHNFKLPGKNNMLRFDFAYNFDKKGLGQIIFSSGQLFSIFGSHQYEIPRFFGEEFDTQ